MAKVKKVDDGKSATTEDDDLTVSLISAINKEFGQRIAYNLAFDESPTEVKRWIETGSVQLNYAIRNAVGGGYPEGRIIEISGMPSCGKSHLAFAAAAHVQRLGGLVVYIDTENAVPIDKLAKVGIDVRKRFVYASSSCTEEVFSIIESTILKAKQVADKNIPILVVWDSVAATSPRAELDGDYDQNTMGLQARVISKGVRKIVGIIGKNNVTLLMLNQLRDAIGVTHGDPHVTPGGKAIPFASSVRIRLTSGTQVKDKQGNIIGSHVTCTIKKNKLAPPWRKMMFDIIFGKGIVEDDYLFDEVRSWCDENEGLVKDGKKLCISGTGAWKELLVTDVSTGDVILSKKFNKSQFAEIRETPAYAGYVFDLIDAALTVKHGEESDHDDSVEVTSNEALEVDEE